MRSSGLSKARWSNAGRALSEIPHFDHIVKNRGGGQLEKVFRDPCLTFGDKNRRAVVVRAHPSNWELLASALGRLGIDNTVLYTLLIDAWFDRNVAQIQDCTQI